MGILSIRTTFLLVTAIVLPILKILSDSINDLGTTHFIWAVEVLGLALGAGYVIKKMMDDKTKGNENVIETILYILLPLIVMLELYWTAKSILGEFTYYLKSYFDSNSPSDMNFHMQRYVALKSFKYVFFFPLFFFLFCWIKLDNSKENKVKKK